jgi:hypothetical protein
MHRAAAWYPFRECVIAHLARQRPSATNGTLVAAVAGCDHRGDVRGEPHARALATALTYVSHARLAVMIAKSGSRAADLLFWHRTR